MDNNRLLCLEDFEEQAQKLLPISAWSYYSSGADNEETLRENREAYRRYWLKPRILRDVSVIDISTSVLGEKVDAPICISPTAFHCKAHSDGEIATCKGAADMNTLMTLSSISNKSLEEVAAARPNSPKWQNVYPLRHRDITKDIVKRAERAGFKAVVMSVDIPTGGFKRRAVRISGQTVFPDEYFGNLDRYINKTARSSPDIPQVDDPIDVSLGDPKSAWEYIDWLKTVTKLPIVLKGILTVEDAILAAEHNVQGILVSNHGGRQLDCVPAPIDALSNIVDAVGDKLEVYVDGGIRTGTDVLKALALGARAVFIGRPVLYGLACNGEEGVKAVLRILREEFIRAMALTGCCRLSDISKAVLVSRSDVLSKL
ncbi:2-Hydroxyacid oxidase 2-like isoform X3 [Ptychodera flava]|uniref:2-Hydroxyacid oxidase 2-like isoform X3 n=1 Tax=Ptychodera flava TaxID=63121 RepID=UPI00396A0A75